MASNSSDWRFESRLPWPGVRGRRLWEHVTGAAPSTSSSGGASASSVRYEVELCEPTAGHIALVLLRRPDGGSGDGGSASPSGDTGAARVFSTAPRHSSTPTVPNASQLAVPRVLYVVDAVAPSRTTGSGSGHANGGGSGFSAMPASGTSTSREPKWTMLSTRANSFGGTTSTSTSLTDPPALAFSSLQQQGVDELELLEELFTTTRATKDACILVKPPLLCARFDCRVVALCFVRVGATAGAGGAAALSTTSASSLSSSSSSTASVAAAPLRCVIAREDGMCYIWEWGADLHQWTFLNRFCFLDNPNLKWTRPVMHFTIADCATAASDIGAGCSSTQDSGDAVELAWWSAETQSEPRLWVRKIQFGIDKNTFRTEIRIGSAFELQRRGVIALRASRNGLFVISATDGVLLRSATSLNALLCSWAEALQREVALDTAPDVLTCVHNVTGELLVLDHATSSLFVVAEASTKAGQRGPRRLASTKLVTLTSLVGTQSTGDSSTDQASPNAPEESDERKIQAIAAHRQLLVVLQGDRCIVYSLVSGDLLAHVPMPTLNWSVDAPLSLWTTNGRASAIGVYADRGFWQLLTPTAQALATLHYPPQAELAKDASSALAAVRPYGTSLQFEASRFALEVLQSARALVVGVKRRAAWEAAVQTVSSPALLLSTVPADQNAPAAMLDELAALVAAVYRITHDVLVTGRFSAAVERRDLGSLRGTALVTQANVEALHHLANWVLLAKRKLARLQSTAVHKGRRHLRARTVSSLTTFEDMDDDENNGGGSAAFPIAFTPLEADADDSSLRLSRKLRPMSSLQFAAGSCSVRHGRQWLEQLESLLLDASDGVAGVPHHLLFHEERTLADFQTALSSFSKHFYFESMSRLYLLHRPAALLAFVRCIAEFCPRLFSLSGFASTVRPHAERALTLLPPAQFFVERARIERAEVQHHATASECDRHERSNSKRRRHARRRQQRQLAVGLASATESLLAYVELLRVCGFYLEACRALLDADLYDECVAATLGETSAQTIDRANATKTLRRESEGDDTGHQLQLQDHVRGAAYFALLEHCVRHREAVDLERLLRAKPPHVSVLLVLRALKQLLPQKIVRSVSVPGNHTAAKPTLQGRVTVGSLRTVLMTLLRAHRSTTAAVAGAGTRSTV